MTWGVPRLSFIRHSVFARKLGGRGDSARGVRCRAFWLTSSGSQLARVACIALSTCYGARICPKASS